MDTEITADGCQRLCGRCQALPLNLGAGQKLAIAWLNVKWGSGFKPLISSTWGWTLAKE